MDKAKKFLWGVTAFWVLVYLVFNLFPVVLNLPFLGYVSMYWPFIFIVISAFILALLYAVSFLQLIIALFK